MITIWGGISGGSNEGVNSVMTDPQGLNILILAGVYRNGMRWTTLLYLFLDLEQREAIEASVATATNTSAASAATPNAVAGLVGG